MNLDLREEKRLGIRLKDGDDKIAFEERNYFDLLKKIVPDMRGFGDIEGFYSQKMGETGFSKKIIQYKYNIKDDDNFVILGKSWNKFFKIPKDYPRDSESKAEYIVKNLIEEISDYDYTLMFGGEDEPPFYITKDKYKDLIKLIKNKEKTNENI